MTLTIPRNFFAPFGDEVFSFADDPDTLICLLDSSDYERQLMTKASLLVGRDRVKEQEFEFR